MITASKTFIYLRLLSRSYGRLFREFPIIVRLLFLVLTVVVGYALVKTKVPEKPIYYAVSTLVFIVLGLKFGSIQSSEKLLLKNLQIPYLFVAALKCLFLTIPFFLLNWIAGVLAMTIGLAVVIFLLSDKKSVLYRSGGSQNKKISFRQPFASAYQWISVCRSEILWVELIVLILYVIALNVRNLNMACVMTGLFVCVPCFFTYYGRGDTVNFMRVYKNAKFLMWRKLIETILYSVVALSLIVSCLFFISDVWLLIRLSAGLLFVNLLMMYVSYLFYPKIVTSLIVLGALFVFFVFAFAAYPMVTTVFCFILLVVLHVFSIRNLKTILYGNA